MPNPKTGESRLVPDLRPENIEEITETYTPEGGEEQTATYKIFKVPAIIRGILDEFAFIRTHARAVWYNKLANRTVADELDALNAKMADIPTNTYITDLKSIFQQCGRGITPIYTNSQSPDLPSRSDEWQYCSGFISKRDSVVGCIVLIGYGTGRIAINTTTSSGDNWSGWVIK